MTPFLDAARSVPFLVWVLIVLLGFVTGFAWLIITCERRQPPARRSRDGSHPAREPSPRFRAESRMSKPPESPSVRLSARLDPWTLIGLGMKDSQP